mmetsp:Transcript_28264/g.59438  ORF Transcript_28264/g.59438 Transcript_28264/m.59438 type:complete len:231 (-) Transcript_28264:275-967(-)
MTTSTIQSKRGLRANGVMTIRFHPHDTFERSCPRLRRLMLRLYRFLMNIRLQIICKCRPLRTNNTLANDFIRLMQRPFNRRFPLNFIFLALFPMTPLPPFLRQLLQIVFAINPVVTRRLRVHPGNFSADGKYFSHVALPKHLHDIVDVRDGDTVSIPCSSGFSLRKVAVDGEVGCGVDKIVFGGGLYVSHYCKFTDVSNLKLRFDFSSRNSEREVVLLRFEKNRSCLRSL